MLVVNILKSLFPAFRGYSQVPCQLSPLCNTSDHASGFDSRRGLFIRVDKLYIKLTTDHSFFQLQSLIASGNFTWSRLLRLTFTELLRRFLEGALECFALVLFQSSNFGKAESINFIPQNQQ
jgi:hypothetical protein